MSMRAPVSIATLVLCWTDRALAGARQADAAPGFGELSQIIGALVVVLALIAALAYGAQRLKLGRPAGTRHLKVIDTLPLGPRDRLLLVEVGAERVLLGCSSGRIERLHVQAAPASFNEVLVEATQETAP